MRQTRRRCPSTSLYTGRGRGIEAERIVPWPRFDDGVPGTCVVFDGFALLTAGSPRSRSYGVAARQGGEPTMARR
jgi:hypothetical protein